MNLWWIDWIPTASRSISQIQEHPLLQISSWQEGDERIQKLGPVLCL